MAEIKTAEHAKQLELAISEALCNRARKYLNLRINGLSVKCPYFMNYDDVYLDTDYYRALPLGGKRTPEEIELFVQDEAKRRNIDLTMLSNQQVRDLLFEIGAGIDCSGFVYNISKYAFEKVSSQAFENFVHSSSDQSLVGVSKICAADLVHPINAMPIGTIATIKPADIISLSGGHHVISILQVNHDELVCAHSTNATSSWGPNIFTITLLNTNDSIFDQDWHELNWEGDFYIPGARKLNLIKANDGVKRLHAFNQLY